MDMTLITQSVLASGPEIIIIIGACIALMLSLVPHPRQEAALIGFSLVMIILAAAMSYSLNDRPQSAYSGMFVVDDFSTFFKMLLYLGTALTVLMSGKYLAKEGVVKGEYYVLLLFSLVGAMIMVSGTDLLMIYIGLELQALSIYVLTGFLKKGVRSNEAALKYVILGAFSSGIFLYGMSLFYGLTGTTQLDQMAIILTAQDLAQDQNDPMLILATLFLLVGLLFKVGAVPFHMWVPDIYEGAPTPITGFMSVAAKAAAFAVIIRIFMDSLVVLQPVWLISVAAIAVLTLSIGSFVALVQNNIKRMLAYSSIAHAGFLLLGLVAGGDEGRSSIMLYLLVYTFMNMGIFAVVVLLNRGSDVGEPLTDFSGLAKSHAGLAFLALFFLFSLAGIPPTGGFFAKFYVLVALVSSGHVALAVIAVVLSAVAAWFYIRIIMLMYVAAPEGPRTIQITFSMKVVLLVTFMGTLLTGILPAWFLDLAGGLNGAAPLPGLG
ncbi:MAG: NADH-quinone oxidoreductase subunit N [Alphaproteobacteria bacterium]|nr:MAG: NADH-quinone oxidoreductase subunit N [Alphaproteobacteria bacterium]